MTKKKKEKEENRGSGHGSCGAPGIPKESLIWWGPNWESPRTRVHGSPRMLCSLLIDGKLRSWGIYSQATRHWSAPDMASSSTYIWLPFLFFCSTNFLRLKLFLFSEATTHVLGNCYFLNYLFVSFYFCWQCQIPYAVRRAAGRPHRGRKKEWRKLLFVSWENNNNNNNITFLGKFIICLTFDRFCWILVIWGERKLHENCQTFYTSCFLKQRNLYGQ